MGTYENPAMISGPNTGSTSSNIGSKTTPNASQDIKNSEMKETTEALNNSEPGNGPIQEAMGASGNGGGGVSENFSLSSGAEDSESGSTTTSENKSTNVSDGGSSSSSYDDIYQKWKEAGGVEIVKGDAEFEDEDDRYDTYYQKDNTANSGFTMTNKEVDEFRMDPDADVALGSGAIPEAKDGVSIHKGPGGNIIENIEGTPGKTRDKAIIYKKPTQKSNTSSTSSNTSSTSSNTESTAQKPQPVDPTAGMNRRQVNKAWRQQNNMGIDGKPLAETGVTTEIRNQAIKRIKQENKAARQAKMQKKLENNPFKQYKKEYRAMDNKPAGVAGHGKVKNARQYAKAKTTPTLGEAYKQKRENSKNNIVNLNTKNGNTKVYDPSKPEGKKVYWTNKQSK